MKPKARLHQKQQQSFASKGDKLSQMIYISVIWDKYIFCSLRQICVHNEAKKKVRFQRKQQQNVASKGDYLPLPTPRIGLFVRSSVRDKICCIIETCFMGNIMHISIRASSMHHQGWTQILVPYISLQGQLLSLLSLPEVKNPCNPCQSLWQRSKNSSQDGILPKFGTFCLLK